jgi:hypothetical protein
MRWLGSLLFGVALAGSPARAQQSATNAPAPPARAPITDEERARREQERVKKLEDDANKAWTELPLGDKQRALDWYRNLAQLPSVEQKAIRERIDRYLHLSGDERKRIEANYERWAQMTPAERDRARQEYLRLRYEYETKWRKDHPNEAPPPFQLPATKVATKPKPAQTNLTATVVAVVTNPPAQKEKP